MNYRIVNVSESIHACPSCRNILSVTKRGFTPKGKYCSSCKVVYVSVKQKNSHFRAGSGSYTCEECGKRTRETGSGESSLHLCAFCYEGSEMVNSVMDGDCTLEEVPEKFRAFVTERV